MESHLIAALNQLDPGNEEHWTADGQARVEVVSELLIARGLGPVQRQNIIDAAPTFTRDSAAAEEPAAPPGPAAAPTHPEPPPAVPGPARSSLLPEGKKACDLPVAEVYASYELLELALMEMSDESQVLIKARGEIDEKLKALHLKSDRATRRLIQIKPKEDSSLAIRAYLESANKAKVDKVARTRAFMQANVKPADVISEMLPGSKLDQVMRQRGAKPGETRPKLGLPVRR